jgi:hypothetical protein
LLTPIAAPAPRLGGSRRHSDRPQGHYRHWDPNPTVSEPTTCIRTTFRSRAAPDCSRSSPNASQHVAPSTLFHRTLSIQYNLIGQHPISSECHPIDMISLIIVGLVRTSLHMCFAIFLCNHQLRKTSDTHRCQLWSLGISIIRSIRLH